MAELENGLIEHVKKVRMAETLAKDGLSAEEIAKAMGISEASVRFLLSETTK